MKRQDLTRSHQHSVTSTELNNSTATSDPTTSGLANAAAVQLLKFSVPRSSVKLVVATICWAVQDCYVAQAIEPDLETFTVLLTPDTLSVDDLAWALSSLPGCMDAALHVAPAAAFTGDPKRVYADLKRPPNHKTAKRCLDGAIACSELLHAELAAAIESTALLQFGIDINEALDTGDDDLAERLCEQSLVSRGAKTLELMAKLRAKR